MSLNSDQLEAFWAVVETGTFHRAAETLYITQSAVTQRIKALEADLGQKLFVRSGRGVALSDAGRRLSRHCQQLRQAEAGLLQELSGSPSSLAGRLAVVSNAAEWRQWLVPVLARLGQAHPALDVALTVGEAHDPAGLLLSCQVDLVISETPIRRRGIQSGRIGALAYGLVIVPELASDLPEAPTWEQLSRMRAIDFSATDRIMLEQLVQCYPGQDLSELRSYYAGTTDAILEWVLAGGGYAAVPLHLVADLLAKGQLRRLLPAVFMERALYWSILDGPVPPIIEAVLQPLRQALTAAAPSGSKRKG